MPDRLADETKELLEKLKIMNEEMAVLIKKTEQTLKSLEKETTMEMHKIAIWPDDTWTTIEDLHEYSWKSDDYFTVEVTDEELEKGEFSYDELIKRKK